MKLLVLMSSLLCLFSESDTLNLNDHKVDEGYIIQELKFNIHPDHHVIFAFATAIYSWNHEYYFIKQEDFLLSIKKGHLALNHHTMVIDPHWQVFTVDENGERERMRINYSNGIAGILQLDDTDIIKIEGKYYVTRKMKYSYMDNIKLMYMDEEEELQPFKVETPRLFLYLIELLPLDDDVKQYVWKKKYELPEFWQEHWQRRFSIKPDTLEQHEFDNRK
jgi:hypothetical protein